MTFPPEVWDGVLRRLEDQLHPFVIETWLRPLAVECAQSAGTGTSVRLRCPTPFHFERVRDHFLGRIEKAFAEETGGEVRVQLDPGEHRGGEKRSAPGRATPPPSLGTAAAPPAGRPEAGGATPGPRPAAPVSPQSRLRSVPARAATPPAARSAPREAAPRARRSGVAQQQGFENFVVGPCNALAREAALALAGDRHPGLSQLYLCASTGLGKTHLARAVSREAAYAGQARVLYASAESFTNDFMAAMRSREIDRFKRRYRRECDLFVLEDVGFLEGKSQTQLELFHTVQHLLDTGARVLLTGSRLPRQQKGLDERLREQLGGGFVAEMEPPDARVRREILRSKAAAGGVHLPPDCLDHLVEEVAGSVRDVEGVLIQLVTTASLLKRPIDLQLTREALAKKRGEGASEVPRPDCDTVIRVVAGFFRTSPEALCSRSRRRDVLVPRQLAMYLCRQYTDASLSEIGKALGRDHPAVKNAVARVQRGMLERAPLRYQVEALSERLEEVVGRSSR